MNLIPFDPDFQGEAPPSDQTRFDSRVPIIIAEDDVVSQTLLKGLLRHAGYDPIVTSNGSDAMTALRLQQKPCIAIVDWMMPEMDGAEVCRRVRASGKLVHIIMLTARDRKENAVEALDAGADDYVIKPFDRGELLARVRAGIRMLNLLALLSRQADVQKADPVHMMQLPL